MTGVVTSDLEVTRRDSRVGGKMMKEEPGRANCCGRDEALLKEMIFVKELLPVTTLEGIIID